MPLALCKSLLIPGERPRCCLLLLKMIKLLSLSFDQCLRTIYSQPFILAHGSMVEVHFSLDTIVFLTARDYLFFLIGILSHLH